MAFTILVVRQHGVCHRGVLASFSVELAIEGEEEGEDGGEQGSGLLARPRTPLLKKMQDIELILNITTMTLVVI